MNAYHFCMKCGTKNQRTSKFCCECGNSFPGFSNAKKTNKKEIKVITNEVDDDYDEDEDDDSVVPSIDKLDCQIQTNSIQQVSFESVAKQKKIDTFARKGKYNKGGKQFLKEWKKEASPSQGSIEIQ